MTEQQAINMVLNLAREEIGYREKASNAYLDEKTLNAGSSNWTKYARDLDNISKFYNGPKNGFAWCDVFVDWLFYKNFGADAAMKMLCQPEYSAGAGCLYSAGYYKNHGRWVTSPQPGDQIFFSYSAGEVSHTGIVEAVSSTDVTTIEGNSSDQVARKTYSLNNRNIYGYGRPMWQYATGTYVPPSQNTTPSTPTMATLRKGSTGEAVRQLQLNLIALGYSCGPDGADGDFGENTYKAVIAFQKDNKLSQDGVAGALTQAVIRQKLNKPQHQQQQQVTGKTYVVQPGDNLWRIAMTQLGSGLKYTQIKKLNGLKSNTLTPGQVLKLP